MKSGRAAAWEKFNGSLPGLNAAVFAPMLNADEERKTHSEDVRCRRFRFFLTQDLSNQ
jgi:hypothetical protein